MERRFEDFDTDFRKDFETNHKSKGLGYDRVRPAYRYGFEAHNRFTGRDWQSIEPELRADWQKQYPKEPWNDFKDAIRTGFDRFHQGAQHTGQTMEKGAHDMGKTMEKGAQHTGQTVEKGAHDMGQSMEKGLDRTTGAMSHSFDTYEKDFRSDFDRSFGSRGSDYKRYRPAYQYGYNLATEKRYQGRNWNDIEMDARRDWQTKYPGEAWDDFKDAVHNAFQRVKSDVKGTSK